MEAAFCVGVVAIFKTKKQGIDHQTERMPPRKRKQEKSEASASDLDPSKMKVGVGFHMIAITDIRAGP